MLSQEEIDSLLASVSVEMPQPVDVGGSASSGSGSSASSSPLMSHTADVFRSGVAQTHKSAYKVYDFRRPDKFSKDHLRALQTIHENFVRQMGMVMTTYLRSAIDIEVVSVDQLTYDEFVRSMPSPMTVGILEFEPLQGQILLGIGFEVTSSIIDRMLGGLGRAEARARELTDIEQSLIRRVMDRMLVCLEDAWNSMVEIKPHMVGMEESFALIQIASPGEIIALITFEITLPSKDSGLISLCIPYPVLESVIGKLNAQRFYHGRKEEAKAENQLKVLDKINYAKIPAQVSLGGTKLSISDLMALEVGDVVRLDREYTEDLMLSINQVPKFYCRAGTVKKNLAVYVVDAVDNQETIEGFGFNEYQSIPQLR